MTDPADVMLGRLTTAGVTKGSLVGLAVSDTAVGIAVGAERWPCDTHEPWRVVQVLERAVRPRWAVWSNATAATLVAHLRLTACWDISAVHRLLHGGWRADPARAWAAANRLDIDDMPTAAPADLFSPIDDSDPEHAVRPDGYLQPAWADGGWAASGRRLAEWAGCALQVAHAQTAQLGALDERPRATATARSESAVELLCAELAADGLPVDRTAMEEVIAGFIGPRPGSRREADELRAARDGQVLGHAPKGANFDLRSQPQVRSLLRSVGVEVPDTRAWRLEQLHDAHPLVAELLAWRKAERVLTTFGYAWLDQHLGADGRLRGAWSGCDGAAGRMTATAGLHNMPADFRAGVVAEDGCAFVRADLGQIEPRVLAVVSGDAALAEAAGEGDMYAPVAARLGVDRATAKVAVLGAMYGQTTGKGAEALRGLSSAYPVAIAYLDAADREGQAGRSVRTFGGRLVRLQMRAGDESANDARSRAAAQGRYGRNAMIQGAAAELFKMWAVTVRARGASLGARIVLCLHDELLVHTPRQHAALTASLLRDCLAEAAHRWAPTGEVRFIADIRIIDRWSDAKDPP
jgi:DNA polymerase I